MKRAKGKTTKGRKADDMGLGCREPEALAVMRACAEKLIGCPLGDGMERGMSFIGLTALEKLVGLAGDGKQIREIRTHAVNAIKRCKRK